jgi:mannose-6-phosphate isomerase-like protein (cupin superfamily)
MDRKQFLNAAGVGVAAAATGGIIGLAGQASAATKPLAPLGGSAGRPRRPVFVPNGRNRIDEALMIWGVIPLQIKVSTNDTDGDLFVFEHADMSKGGPPRHFHYAQDEWFHAVKGEFLFEVGDERFTLRPGDSLFAPRMIPHVWAYVGDNPGTLLLAVQPAGSLEAFFMQSAKLTRPPTPEEADRQFAAHGMKVVGPPLDVR